MFTCVLCMSVIKHMYNKIQYIYDDVSAEAFTSLLLFLSALESVRVVESLIFVLGSP